MKRLIAIILILSCFTSFGQLKEVYRITLKKPYKGAQTDTVYLRISQVQISIENNRTWVSLNEFKSYKACISDSAFIDWQTSPTINLHWQTKITSTINNLSDSIKAKLAVKYKVNLGKITKL